jgi:hypothetical protein
MSKPTIVIVPGSFTSGSAYETLTSILTKQYNYEVIVGTLQSTSRAPPEKPATMQEDAAYFRGIIEALSNQGKDVVVVGHSYGGIVATESVKKVTKLERQAQGKSAGGVVRVIYLASLIAQIGETALQVIGGQLGPVVKILVSPLHFLNIVSEKCNANFFINRAIICISIQKLVLSTFMTAYLRTRP